MTPLIELPWSTGTQLLRPLPSEELLGKIQLAALRGVPVKATDLYSSYRHTQEGYVDLAPPRAADLLGLNLSRAAISGPVFSTDRAWNARAGGEWLPTNAGAPKAPDWSAAATQLLFWTPELHLHARTVMQAHLAQQMSGSQRIRAQHLILAALPLMTAINTANHQLSAATLNAGIRALLAIQSLCALISEQPEQTALTPGHIHLTYGWWLSAGKPITLPDPNQIMAISLSLAQLSVMCRHQCSDQVRPALLAAYDQVKNDWSGAVQNCCVLKELSGILESWHGAPATATLRPAREAIRAYQTNLGLLWNKQKNLNAVRRSLPATTGGTYKHPEPFKNLETAACGALASTLYEQWATNPRLLTPNVSSHLGQVAINLKERTDLGYMLAGPELQRAITTILGSPHIQLSGGERAALRDSLSLSLATQATWAHHARNDHSHEGQKDRQ